jgi:hypothetical protein
VPKSKRRIPADVKEVEVEAIVWRDAQRQSREHFDPEDTMLLVTYGTVIHESDDSLWIASEHRYTPEFMRNHNTMNQDRTEIPKANIIKRTKGFVLQLVDEEDLTAGKEHGVKLDG